MSKRDEIIALFNKKLFSLKLDDSDFLNKHPLPDDGKGRPFKCDCAQKCGVDPRKHPIWTPALGDEESEVMVVGEAPSATGGLGVNIGGLFEQWEDERKSHVTDLRDWVKDNLGGKVPYFTDLAKCGVANQKNKAGLARRIKKCRERFLIEEIRILNPKWIFCIGNTAHKFVSELITRERLSSQISLRRLTHYSGLASLPLTIEDKKNLIWKWEAGFLRDEELKEKLFELSYFRTKKSISESR